MSDPIFDHAWACTLVIEDMLQDVLNEREIAKFRAQCVEAIVAMLQYYEAGVDRPAQWRRPQAN